MQNSYIGITDFTASVRTEQMLEVFERASGDEFKRLLMVGVMMSYKTLNNLATKWANVFPPKESVRDIFVPHPLALNTLHYADYDAIDVAENIERATRFSGPNIDAIQLDMIWPEPKIVMEYRDRHPEIKVIIQGNQGAIEAVDGNPLEFVAKLRDYKDAIDYILLDKSMGKGLGMDAMGLRVFAWAVKERLPLLGIVVAGGLGPDTLHLVEPLIQEFPNISIDAQGKLRPSGSALDPIHWDMASEYLKRAIKLFKKHQKTA